MATEGYLGPLPSPNVPASIKGSRVRAWERPGRTVPVLNLRTCLQQGQFATDRVDVFEETAT
jgi:hypothetical protein